MSLKKITPPHGVAKRVWVTPFIESRLMPQTSALLMVSPPPGICCDRTLPPCSPNNVPGIDCPPD